jgi:hypothetical protein
MAAIDFMGCTHMGTSHHIPVTILNMPPNKSEAEREIWLLILRETRIGNSVPRSPELNA